ncbi:MAG: biotin transporter BioY, partial [Clostridia bacterium]|nr:biotin transporter BioY [Clostridia bacterium]
MNKYSTKLMAVDIAECAVFVALMIAGAYIKIPFPFMPLTFQTVFAVLAGLLLGWKKGIIAMTVYAFVGLVGLPVFTSGGGFSYVLMPSFGYIIGFIASAGVAG